MTAIETQRQRIAYLESQLCGALAKLAELEAELPPKPGKFSSQAQRDRRHFFGRPRA